MTCWCPNLAGLIIKFEIIDVSDRYQTQLFLIIHEMHISISKCALKTKMPAQSTLHYPNLNGGVLKDLFKVHNDNILEMLEEL